LIYFIQKQLEKVVENLTQELDEAKDLITALRVENEELKVILGIFIFKLLTL
jgi:hypothetical protein